MNAAAAKGLLLQTFNSATLTRVYLFKNAL